MYNSGIDDARIITEVLSYLYFEHCVVIGYLWHGMYELSMRYLRADSNMKQFVARLSIKTNQNTKKNTLKIPSFLIVILGILIWLISPQVSGLIKLIASMAFFHFLSL